MAVALHYNEKKKKIEPLLDIRPLLIDSKSGGVRLAGIELLSTLREGNKNKRFHVYQQNKLKTFLKDESATALLDGIAALYLHLDALEHNQEMGKLIASFGATRTAIELISGQYHGVEKVVAASTLQKANTLQQACADGKCLYRGNKFVVHRSGFFDVLSASHSKLKTSYSRQAYCPPGTSLNAKVLSTSINASADNNDCHGYCGAGCFNPGNIATPECKGHDDCVDNYGHLACMFGVPDDCSGCNSLVEAIASYISALFGGGGRQ